MKQELFPYNEEQMAMFYGIIYDFVKHSILKQMNETPNSLPHINKWKINLGVYITAT